MDIKNLTFKQIEKLLNDAITSVIIAENENPAVIKNQIFRELERRFPMFNMRQVDYLGNQFELKYAYNKSFRSIPSYDEGEVAIVFKVKTMRTDKLVDISKTKKKYIHAKSDKSISYYYASVRSYVPGFEWASEDPSDLTIAAEGRWSSGNKEVDELTGTSVAELLGKLEQTYEKQYVSGIVQPIVKTLYLRGEKYEAVKSAMTDEMKRELDSETLSFERIVQLIEEKKWIG